MTSLVLSFLTVIAIPVMVILSIAGVSVTLLRRPWPSTRKLLADIAISVLITVGITFGISLVLSWTGFFHSQFYRPSAREFDEPQKLGLETEDRFFKSQDGTELHGWSLPATSTANGTVIHFHGSDRNISFTVRNGEWLRSRGFNVFVFDNRGYGKSKGTPSRQGMVEDGIAAMEDVQTLPRLTLVKAKTQQSTRLATSLNSLHTYLTAYANHTPQPTSQKPLLTDLSHP